MPSIPSVDTIIGDLAGATSKVVKGDITLIRGFSERQMRMMATHARWIAEAEARGEFAHDPKLRDWFLTNLDNMARDFAQSLKGLLMITVEKVWNAVVNVLWGVVEAGAGFKLPRPV